MKSLNAFLFLSLATTCMIAAPANAAPNVSMGAVDTPYGKFACKQRAQTKFFAMGATGVSAMSSGNTVWGQLGDNTLGAWCRGTEVTVVVAGDFDSPALRDEIRSAF